MNAEVPENPPLIDPPDYKYEEINKKDMGEIARSEPPKGSETIKPEATPAELEVEVEDLTKKAAEEAARTVLAEQEAQKIAAEEARKAEENKPKSEADKVYEDWAAKFNEQNSRPPTYLEAMQFVKEQAKAEIQSEQQQAYQKYQEEQKALQEAKEAEDKQVNAFVDDGLQELYKTNKLTKIQDPNNPSDPGIIEKKSLFAKWAEVNTQRKAQGLPEIFDVTRVANYYWTKPNTQPAGADAPVQGSRSATATDDGKQYTNADLKKPWSFWKIRG